MTTVGMKGSSSEDTFVRC